ncbi:ABC transporter substrate-binding protein [Marivibrio halodurans]|uniref:ABC transporter substrate-binding protein n=1 Tax=Marivibrio halodurans TaxID=2039722 RepID=A0A8J7V2H5_9PROT|nr:ABC transporter substrate-binding protein [Marivibrio halodurans]MBP5858841.1 ABC transporter substrate-binding protein [Marivibrio halodurans]
MRFTRLTATIAAGAFALGLGMGAASAEDTLRIGVEGAYPPFSWTEADGTLKGFDIDIARALCEQMGRDCELVPQDWDGIIPALLAKKYDAIVASMSITEERKKRVNFTDKYYNTPAKFVAPADADFEATTEGLDGKVVGVQRGTIHQCYMEKAFPDVELALYATQEEVFLDLASGRIDAQISDSIQAKEGFLDKEEGEGFAFLGDDQFDLECHGEGAGIAVRKEDDDLRVAFNDAIKALRENGTYAEINDKYFEFDVYGAEPGS